MADKKPFNEEVKKRLLDHLIQAVLDAIQRGRAAWLLGVIIVFVFGIQIFNAKLSWNKQQIERRATLYSVATGGYESLELLVNKAEFDDDNEKSASKALKHIERTSELKYISRIWQNCKEINEKNIENEKKRQEELNKIQEQNSRDERNGKFEPDRKIEKDRRTECIKDFKHAVFSDLDTLINRRTTFDTVGIPFIGASVTGSDYGIIGGIALIIVGYWLLAMLRREHLALSEFVVLSNKGKGLKQGFSKYEKDDLIYACKRIKHYMVFSMPEPGAWLSYVTYVTFLIAPILLLINHIVTIVDLYSTSIMTGYLDWHPITELLICIIGSIVWLWGLLYQYRTMQIMECWESECNDKDGFQAKRFFRDN